MSGLRSTSPRQGHRGVALLPVVLLLTVATTLLGCTSGGGPTSPTDETALPPSAGGTAETPLAPANETPGATSPGKGTARPGSPARPDQARLNEQLITAATRGDVPAARRLITAGADVNFADDSGQSAYLIATSEGNLDLLELTLRSGADVGALDSFNGTGLIRAADRGHAMVVGRLLRTDIKVDHVNNLGWTALHEAIILGDGSTRYQDCVRLLVAGSADLELPSTQDGVSPLRHARLKGHDALARTLSTALEAGKLADPDRALLRAAAAGDADQVALAVRSGASIEARDGQRRTPLLLAATNDRLAAARVLVALGADPDALDDRHDTPWLVTGVTGSVQMAEVLLRAGPDLSIRNRFGGTSLIPASERGHVAYVRRVVKTGIDVDHVNDLGWTALLEAVILGDGSQPYQQIVRTLLDAGADPNLADRDGTTPLQHAEARNQLRVAAILRAAR